MQARDPSFSLVLLVSLKGKKKNFFFLVPVVLVETFVLIHRYEMLCRGYQSGKNNVLIRIVMLLILCVVNTSKSAELCLGVWDLSHRTSYLGCNCLQL